jgi:hypothetical protein
MKNLKGIITVFFVIGAMVISAFWWFERPQRITQEFVGHLFHERYSEANSMLEGGSSLRSLPEGGLLVSDQAGNSVTVPKEKLPFKVSGGKARQTCDFSMTALGGSVGGVLSTPPVVLYLNVEGGKVRIERIES